MSGSLLLIGEIVVFMALATLVGFAVGRVTRRVQTKTTTAESTAMRERNALLEREVDELTAALVEARNAAPEAELSERAAMAEREAEGLSRRLQEAAQRIDALERERSEWLEVAEATDSDGVDVPVATGDESEETQELRAELERRSAHIARLEQVAADAQRLEQELSAREDRIDQLERVLEANAAGRALADAEAASIGTSVGAGSYADSRLTFDPTDGS